MSSPEPATAPLDPAAYAPRRMFTPVFWVVIAFGLLFMLAGVAVWSMGPKLFPPKPAAAPPLSGQPAAIAPPTVDERLADIQARLQAQEKPPVESAAPASAELEMLSQRVDRLEDDRRRITLAAAGAIAAASLSDAAAASRPFSGELAMLEASLPESADLRALRPLSQTGAPTLASLAAEYPDAAARAAVASRARATGTGVLAQIAQAFAAILTIRRVDKLDGQGVDAVLARAGRRVDQGDLAGALAEINNLPQAGRDAMNAWSTGARRRVEIDRRVSGVRGTALAELTRATRDAAQP